MEKLEAIAMKMGRSKLARVRILKRASTNLRNLLKADDRL